MPTYLHLVVDDKFIDGAIREFEAVAPGQHEYLILDAPGPYRYLKSPRVRCMRRDEWAARVRRPDVTAVLLHSLPREHHAAVAAIPPGPGVVWIGWGYDYGGLMADAFPDGLYGPATSAVVASLSPRDATPAPGRLQASQLSIARPYPKPSRDDRAVLERIDFFSPVLEQEWQLVRRHQPWFQAGYLPWNYLTVEDDLVVEGDGVLPLGGDVLLGNSATPANNHLEAFELLQRQLPLEGRRIVAPLSYGDAAYADAVTRAGRQRFGKAFVPLRDYMPKDDYIRTLQACGIVVMNHVRQQAVGNLLIAALMGARLFLDPRNPTLRWLRRQGVPAESTAALHGRPLERDQRAAQVAAVKAFACREPRRAVTRALLEQALRPRRVWR